MVQWVHFILLSFCCLDFLLEKLQELPSIYNFWDIPDSQNVLCNVFRSFNLCQFSVENTFNKCLLFYDKFFPRDFILVKIFLKLFKKVQYSIIPWVSLGKVFKNESYFPFKMTLWLCLGFLGVREVLFLVCVNRLQQNTFPKSQVNGSIIDISPCVNIIYKKYFLG